MNEMAVGSHWSQDNFVISPNRGSYTLNTLERLRGTNGQDDAGTFQKVTALEADVTKQDQEISELQQQVSSLRDSLNKATAPPSPPAGDQGEDPSQRA